MTFSVSINRCGWEERIRSEQCEKFRNQTTNLEEFRRIKTHLSVEELANLLSKRIDELNLSGAKADEQFDRVGGGRVLIEIVSGRKGALVDALVDRHVHFRYLVRSIKVVNVDLARGVEADELGGRVLYEAERALDTDVRLRRR